MGHHRVRARVGSRGFSLHVADAVVASWKRGALDDLLARMEAAHGPVDKDDVATILGRLAR